MNQEGNDDNHAASLTLSVVPTETTTAPRLQIVPNDDNTSGKDDKMDFVGSSDAVKDLFSIPFDNRQVHVAIHNMGGTLLIDAAGPEEALDKGESSNHAKREHETTKHHELLLTPSDESCMQLIALPTEEQQQQNVEALSLIQSFLSKSTKESRNNASSSAVNNVGQSNETKKQQQEQQQHGQYNLGLPPPEHYTGRMVPREPREYHSWKFHNLNLLVGSDAIVYRPTDSTSRALTIRVEDAAKLKMQMASMDPNKKETYASVLSQEQTVVQDPSPEQDESTFSSPDSVVLRLQSCVVPSTTVMGGYEQVSSSTASTNNTNAVCTVLDAYLDNIMANVPQLALCLYEQGFIQSIKLLETQDIPSNFMHPSTLDPTCAAATDSSSSSSSGNNNKHPALFSTQVMEMNASMLLQFLRSNCNKDHATYLLTRKEGQFNIQLYDVSSVSAQRQYKWIYWLASMSWRFALRLGQLSKTNFATEETKRVFRARQRSLLQNALELLQDLNDRDGPAHETFCAAICEHLADTFLVNEPQEKQQQKQQPYEGISGDALNKAQDHLINGIRILMPVLERDRQRQARRAKRRATKQEESSSPTNNSNSRRVVVVVHNDDGTSSSSEDEEETSGSSGDGEYANQASPSPLSMQAEAVTMQLFGLHHKLINVNLRLAEHHLNNYWSSSAMQALRTAGRRMAHAVSLLEPLVAKDSRLKQSLQFQYAWLWEHCGFFARSFAADELWRDRGHCSGDDIVSLLRDVEAALLSTPSTFLLVGVEAPITKKTASQVSLASLDPIVGRNDEESSSKPSKPSLRHNTVSLSSDSDALEAARAVLAKQKLIKRDEQRVLVAACICYSRAIGTFSNLEETETDGNPEPKALPPSLPSGGNSTSILQQRLGDACNEVGKLLLQELRTVLVEQDFPFSEMPSSRAAAEPLLSSSQFWFLEGLRHFEECNDMRNIALLRCNLCQCCKLKANNMFLDNNAKGNHAETCLQDAADQLQLAHETLGQRDVDPMTWDMVSDELAATFLVLGVRRRQSLLGGGTTPVVMQAMRLNPGKERSIADPMERALKIYEQSGNAHQAAAVHYQLALLYSKVWTCQRDETKTREKLAAAFHHYGAAHAYFSVAPRGTEPTFCILCLDLSNLYQSVSGQECLSKALDRCLDTANAFSAQAVESATQRGGFHSEWLDKMQTLASSVEDRVFKLLLSLVKLEKETTGTLYKDLYRVALTTKATINTSNNADATERLLRVNRLLTTIRQQKDGELVAAK